MIFICEECSKKYGQIIQVQVEADVRAKMLLLGTDVTCPNCKGKLTLQSD